MSLATRIAEEFNSREQETSGALYSSSGYTTKVAKTDRWLETDTPNVIVDQVGDDYVIDGVVYNQLGEELVTNGTFDTDVSGWTSTGNDLVESSNISSGELTLTRTSTDYEQITQGISTIVGKTYFLNYNVVSQTSTEDHVYIGTTSGGSEIANLFRLGTGSHTQVFTATTTTTYITLRNAGVSASVWDNISVKEVIQAELPEAPFAPTSTDELLDDSVNGLTTQQAHSKGDIVVTGNELVENGTFDSDTSGWNAYNYATLSVDEGRLKITNGTSVTGWAYQQITTVAGKKYILNFEAQKGTANADLYGARADTITGTTLLDLNTGTNTYMERFSGEFTATSTTTFIVFRANSIVTGQYAYFDNISVRLADTSYQATRDTADMYDYDDSVNNSVWNEGEVVYCTGANANGTVGHFYLNKGVYNNVNPNTATLTSSAYEDLGTASNMSLENPYFQVISDVTRHDIIALSPTGYKTYKGLNYYQDDTLDRDTIARDRGWSKLGNNTYVDEDGDKVAIVGVRPTLNAGAFHPDYNFYGCKQRFYLDSTDGSTTWYYSGTADIFLNSVYDHFMIGSTSNPAKVRLESGLIEYPTREGRPDKAVLDKVYTEGEGGLIQLGYNYAKDDVNAAQEAGKREDYVSSGVECYGVGSRFGNYAYINLGSKAEVYMPYKTAADNFEIGDWVTVQSLTDNAIIAFKINTIVEQSDGPNDIILTTNTSDIIVLAGQVTTSSYHNVQVVTKKSQTHLTQGQALTTDLIGFPASYPSFLKNTLASGKSVHINPLLVDQNGTSLISYFAGTNISLSKKVISGYAPIYSNDGVSYLTTTPIPSSITNYTTMNGTDGRHSFNNYTSANSPAQSTPKQVVEVVDKVNASNSHSIYKGALIANATGYVSTGNGNNGFESKYLEDTFVPKINWIVENNIVIDRTVGDLYFIKGGASDEIGRVYLFRGTPQEDWNTGTDYDFSENTIWQEVGIAGLPSHSTLTLDNSSNGAKWFDVLAVDDNNQYCIDTYVEQMIYDSGWGDDDTFEQLTNGTVTDLNGNTVKTLVVSKPLGTYKK